MSVILTIVCVGLIAYTTIYFLKKKDYTNENVLGTIASTIGVLGTFVGIFIGLMGFDPNNITESVPQLLEGMKIAFATSIVGMTSSIIMKFITFKNTKEETDENIDDIVELFNRMIKENSNVNKTLLENQNQTSEIFAKLSESFFLNQQELKEEIRSLNNNTIAKQEELISEFKAFGNEMAKNNSEALIDALNDVIKDFNNKISEQFGENFKELNSAVGALLVWQENYKETIDKTTIQLDQTLHSIKNIDESIEKIASNSNLIKENNENLNNILIDVTKTQDNMKLSMESLVEVSNKAKESIPTIDKYFEDTNVHIRNTVDSLQDSMEKNINLVENHIEKLTIDVSQASATSIEEIKNLFKENNEQLKIEVKEYIENFETVINQLRTCIPEVNEHLQQTNERFNNTLNAFTSEVQNTLQLNMEYMNGQAETLKNTTASINNSLDTVITDSTKRLEDITVNTSSQIKTIVEEMEKVFEQKVEQLDELLETELTKSLNSLGGQLVTISERFTQDYTPLADRLREVVKIAEGAR